MIQHSRASLLLWAMVAIFAMPSAGATAAEEPPVVKALLDGAGLNAAARPTYRSLEVAGDGSITLKGLQMTYKGGDEPASAMSYNVESVKLDDVKEGPGGLFQIGSAEWSGISLKLGDDPVAAIPLISGRSVYIVQPSEPPTTLQKMRASNMLGKEFAMPEAVVELGGQKLVLENVQWSWDGDPLTGAGRSEFDVGRIRIPAAMLQDEQGQNPVVEAGYGDLEFSIEGEGTTTLAEQAWGFDFQMRLNGSDMGTLALDFAADGFPMALFGALDAANPEVDQIIPLVQGITVKRAKVRFEDASLTQRIVTMMAKAQGTDDETFITSTTEGLKVALAAFKDQKLSGEALSALTSFLRDPKAITLSVNPAQPIRVDQLMNAAQDPTAMLDKLNVSITAND